MICTKNLRGCFTLMRYPICKSRPYIDTKFCGSGIVIYIVHLLRTIHFVSAECKSFISRPRHIAIPNAVSSLADISKYLNDTLASSIYRSADSICCRIFPIQWQQKHSLLQRRHAYSGAMLIARGAPDKSTIRYGFLGTALVGLSLFENWLNCTNYLQGVSNT